MRITKVAHLSSVHPAFDARIFHKECKTLSDSGYEVVLIIQHSKDEVVEGVRIKALPKPRNRFDRMVGLVWNVLRKAMKEKADVYHFHDPELIPVGIILALTGKKVIYDVHEDLPRDILTKSWIPIWLRKPISLATEIIERLAAKIFAGVVTVTPTICRRFPAHKTAMVQNFPGIEELTSVCDSPYIERPPIFIYVGYITVIRGIREMVDAMTSLPIEIDAQLVLGGKFTPSELQREIEKYEGWNRVDYVGWLSRNDVGTYLSTARAGLVTLHPTKNHMEAQPNKLFEYMSASIPVIASDFPIWRKIIQESGCGLLVDPMRPESIANAIQWILDHPDQAEEMGRRGRNAVLEKYNWEKEAEMLLAFYDQILGAKK